MQVPNNRTGFKTFGHSKVAMTSWEGQVGNGETVGAHSSTRDQGRRAWDRARGRGTPSLVGESEVLYRTVYSFGVLHSKDRTVVV